MIYQKFHNSDASILIWEITESEDDLKKLLSNFSWYEPEFFALKTNKRRLEFLAARVALNLLSDTIINVAYTSEGKPFCDGTDLQISISHSGNLIAVMTHPTHHVGIDIEVPTDRFLKLYQRFLNKNEQEALFDAGDLRKGQLAWSAKEALYKIIGNEAVNFDKQLEIADFELCNSGSFVGEHTVIGKKYTLFYITCDLFNLVYCIDI